MRSAKHVLLSGAAIAAVAVTAPAFAQPAENRDEIVVTATKRESTVQDVPFSINAQTEEQIQRTGSGNIEEVARNVAGLSIQNFGPGQSQVAIRGVSQGQIVRDQPGVKEQVGVYLDESVISLSLFTPDLDLFDLNRVETLRGPQGTLFGSGSVGGTIRYITNQPALGKEEFAIEGNLNRIDGGGFGGHAKAMINVPMGQTAALRIAGYHTEYGGFIDALKPTTGSLTIEDDVNSGSRTGVRAAIRWEPTERIDITPRLIYQSIDTEGFNRQEVYNVFLNRNTTVPLAHNYTEQQQTLILDEGFSDKLWIGDLTMNFDVGPVTLTSVTSYTNRDILVSRDASALTGSVTIDLAYPNLAVNGRLPSNLRDTTDVEQWTQEARIASNTEGRFDWLLGFFYSSTDRFYSQRLPTPGYQAATDLRFGAGTSAAVANGFTDLNSPYNADLPYNLRQYAIFGEGTFAVTDRFDFTAGLRWYDFRETRSFVSGGLFSNGDNRTDTTKSDGFAPRFILAYEASDDLKFNAQASKGFRLGGANDPLNIPLCAGGAGGPDALTYGNRPTFDDEKLWNYEGGAKYSKGGVTANLAGFFTDIKDLQITADAGSCSSRVVFNVPKARSIGVEAEFGVALDSGISLSVNGSWQDAKIKSDVRDAGGAVIAGIRDGNRLPTVPRLQISANASYDFKLASHPSYFSVTFQHVGDRYTQLGDQEGNPRTFVSGLAFAGAPATTSTTLDLLLPSYQIVNLSAGMDVGKWSLIAYVNNVTDENALLSFDRERGRPCGRSVGGQGVRWPCRTFGGGRARLGFNVNQPRTFGVTARVKF